MIKVFVRDGSKVVDTAVFRKKKNAEKWVADYKAGSGSGYAYETQLMLFDEEIRLKAKGMIDKHMLRAYDRAIKQLQKMVAKLEADRNKIEANLKR